MDVSEWFTDGELYYLPDGTMVRAVLEERDDTWRWILSDLGGQRLFIFMEDGRVRAYVWERIAYFGIDKGNTIYESLRMVPCDLTIEDLRTDK